MKTVSFFNEEKSFITLDLREIMGFIDVKNLVYKYKMYFGEKEEVKENTAINDISLSVNKGDFIGILGHNGSGKSTLAKQLAALLKPTDGIVYVDGKNTAESKDVFAIRQTAGMVFQNPDNQLIGNVVEEDVAFGPENLGVVPEEIDRRITRALDAVGMSGYRQAVPGNLSGGQKQKIAISSILAMEPSCIIFDEPTAMIDPQGRKEVLGTIETLNKEKKITILYITHFPEEVLLADYLYVMNQGRITLQGKPADLLKCPEKMSENHLELPFVQKVIQSLKEFGIEVPEQVITREELLCFLEKNGGKK